METTSDRSVAASDAHSSASASRSSQAHPSLTRPERSYSLERLVDAWELHGAPMPVAVVVSIFDDLLALAIDGDVELKRLSLADVVIEPTGFARLVESAVLSGTAWSIGPLFARALGAGGEEAIPSAAYGLVARLGSDDPLDRPLDAEQLRGWIRETLGSPATREEVAAALAVVAQLESNIPLPATTELPASTKPVPSAKPIEASKLSEAPVVAKDTPKASEAPVSAKPSLAAKMLAKATEVLAPASIKPSSIALGAPVKESVAPAPVVKTSEAPAPVVKASEAPAPVVKASEAPPPLPSARGVANDTVPSAQFVPSTGPSQGAVSEDAPVELAELAVSEAPRVAESAAKLEPDTEEVELSVPPPADHDDHDTVMTPAEILDDDDIPELPKPTIILPPRRRDRTSDLPTMRPGETPSDAPAVPDPRPVIRHVLPKPSVSVSAAPAARRSARPAADDRDILNLPNERAEWRTWAVIAVFAIVLALCWFKIL